MKTNVFNRLHFVALSAILFLASGNAIAQSNAKSATVHGENNPVFINVDPVPVFPGGQTELMKFINENLRYPAAAIENGIQGRVVVQFVVKKDRGIDPTLDEEAVRVCKALPKFIPTKQSGIRANVWFTLPITFKLDEAPNNLQTDESEDMANDTIHNREIMLRPIMEQMPEFPGGQAALLKFINENLRYPATAIENGIQGRVVVQFVVKKDGSVNDNIMIVRGVDPALDQEAIRVCKTLPKFIPGKRRDNGEPINAWITLPITFKLDEAPNNLQTDKSEDMSNDTIHNRELIFRHVEQMPEFPGGEAALMKFINENLRYPAAAIENGIQGRVVVQFVVKKERQYASAKHFRNSSPAYRMAYRSTYGLRCLSFLDWNSHCIKRKETAYATVSFCGR